MYAILYVEFSKQNNNTVVFIGQRCGLVNFLLFRVPHFVFCGPIVVLFYVINFNRILQEKYSLFGYPYLILIMHLILTLIMFSM